MLLGLVVRRPSTRVTPKFQEPVEDGDSEDFQPIVKTEKIANGKTGAKTPERSVKNSVASPGGTPVMPTLKTFTWESTVNITTKVPYYYYYCLQPKT